MLERSGVHQDERRMDHRPRVHQRRRERVLDGLDREDFLQHRQARARALAGYTPVGNRVARAVIAAVVGTVLAREPRQRARLGERDLGLYALRHDPGAEGAGREEHHLAIREMRRDALRVIDLRERRVGQEDELGAADRLADVRPTSTRSSLAARPPHP